MSLRLAWSTWCQASESYIPRPCSNKTKPFDSGLKALIIINQNFCCHTDDMCVGAVHTDVTLMSHYVLGSSAYANLGQSLPNTVVPRALSPSPLLQWWRQEALQATQQVQGQSELCEARPCLKANHLKPLIRNDSVTNQKIPQHCDN